MFPSVFTETFCLAVKMKIKHYWKWEADFIESNSYEWIWFPPAPMGGPRSRCLHAFGLGHPPPPPPRHNQKFLVALVCKATKHTKNTISSTIWLRSKNAGKYGPLKSLYSIWPQLIGESYYLFIYKSNSNSPEKRSTWTKTVDYIIGLRLGKRGKQPNKWT